MSDELKERILSILDDRQRFLYETKGGCDELDFLIKIQGMLEGKR